MSQVHRKIFTFHVLPTDSAVGIDVYKRQDQNVNPDKVILIVEIVVLILFKNYLMNIDLL